MITEKVSIQPTLFDVETVRKDFPILNKKVHGHLLAYLDNAATTQKPEVVIKAISAYYEGINANVHRGVHRLSEEATDAFENARTVVKNFINAKSEKEIVFVRGTTEAINLVAQSYGRDNIQTGDEVIVTELEHHSNIVPWQLLCEQVKATLKVIPINDRGELILEELPKLINNKTKLIAVTAISNALGTINPIEKIIEVAHANDIPVLVDAAQAIPHEKVDVQAWDCDFLAFSGHKAFGPTGIGILYAKEALLEKMPPYQGGGEMILKVSFDETIYNRIPHKFEAGTPNIAGAVGLGEALNYIEKLGIENIANYEQGLLQYAKERLSAITDIRFIGTAQHKTAVVSFVYEDVHPHDVGTYLDSKGIAIRTGHHCAMPAMDHFGIPGTSRASFSFYNTKEEIDRLADALTAMGELFKI